MRSRAVFLISAILPFGLTLGLPMAGGDCAVTQVGLVPITELAGTYQGYEGYLYDGSNIRPETLTAAAPAVVPINGRIVVVSLGMSNTAQEFDVFMHLASADEAVNPQVKLVNMAYGGCVAKGTAEPNGRCWTAFEANLRAAGVTFEEVQVIWFKSTSTTRGTTFPASKDWLLRDLRGTLDLVSDYMPNVKQIYVSSRIYGGYAIMQLDPEPFAYETAFAFKELVRTQHPGHWISWGPYLWADGLQLRSDGLFWPCEDFESDGTHPSLTGRLKVAHLLLDFLKTDAVARRWFLAEGDDHPDEGFFSGLIQELIDDIRSGSMRASTVLVRLEAVRDLLIEAGL